MKTKEELNALKNEVEMMDKKLSKLKDEELAQVAGGVNPCTDGRERQQANSCFTFALLIIETESTRLSVKKRMRFLPTYNTFGTERLPRIWQTRLI